MNIVYEILIDSALILIFILVTGAFCYSALILFKPKTALQLNSRFNSWVSTDKVDVTANTHIDTHGMVLKYRWWVGSLFLAGALFALKFLLLDFDVDKFITVVVDPKGEAYRALSEIAVISIQWLLVFTSFIGALACGIVLVNPEAFERLSDKLDTHYSTDHIKERADTVYTALDEWVMQNHVLVGLLLFLGSTYLVVILLITLI